MNLKELYLKNEKRRYCNVTGIKDENLKLEMKPLRKVGERFIVLLIVLGFIIVLLTINFNIKYFLTSLVIILVLFLTYIFGNKSSLTCDKKAINIKQGFQNVDIPYEKLKSVYIGKVSGMLFFLPAFSYNIIIRYEDNFSFLREFEFSLLCADEKEVEAFINNFEIEEIVVEQYVHYEKRKFLKKLIGTIFTLALAIIILVYLYSAGVINLNFLI